MDWDKDTYTKALRGLQPIGNGCYADPAARVVAYCAGGSAGASRSGKIVIGPGDPVEEHVVAVADDLLRNSKGRFAWLVAELAPSKYLHCRSIGAGMEVSIKETWSADAEH